MNTARFRFHLNWKITLFTAVLFPFLVYLGVWQLGRAEQKQTILQEWQQQQAKPPVEFSPTLNSNDQFRRVWLNGTIYQDKYWLIENKTMYGRLGAYVVVAVNVNSSSANQQPNTIVPVNLGWVELPPLREVFPDITLPTGQIRITGMLAAATHSPLINEAENTQLRWPHKMLEIDLTQMQQQFGQPLYPLVLQVDPDSAAAFDVDWQAVNMTSSQHKGYAVQWFTMAGVLFILWLLACSNLATLFKRANTEQTET